MLERRWLLAIDSIPSNSALHYSYLNLLLAAKTRVTDGHRI